DDDYVMRVPYRGGHVPDAITRTRIANYFAAVTSSKRATIEKWLPEVMPRWGKMRILGGDSFRAACA
ncbi:hypothetical protein R3P38DRAFT_2477138, partial [Favolaschia claudopus]